MNFEVPSSHSRKYENKRIINQSTENRVRFSKEITIINPPSTEEGVDDHKNDQNDEFKNLLSRIENIKKENRLQAKEAKDEISRFAENIGNIQRKLGIKSIIEKRCDEFDSLYYDFCNLLTDIGGKPSLFASSHWKSKKVKSIIPELERIKSELMLVKGNFNHYSDKDKQSLRLKYQQISQEILDAEYRKRKKKHWDCSLYEKKAHSQTETPPSSDNRQHLIDHADNQKRPSQIQHEYTIHGSEENLAGYFNPNQKYFVYHRDGELFDNGEIEPFNVEKFQIADDADLQKIEIIETYNKLIKDAYQKIEEINKVWFAIKEEFWKSLTKEQEKEFELILSFANEKIKILKKRCDIFMQNVLEDPKEYLENISLRLIREDIKSLKYSVLLNLMIKKAIIEINHYQLIVRQSSKIFIESGFSAL